MTVGPIIIRIPRPIAYGAAVLLVVSGTLAIAELSNRGPGSAEHRVDVYLSALRREDARAAWPMLTRRVRTIWGSFEAFETAVQGSDWSAFDYEILGSRCDDGICAVDLSIPNGVDSVPLILYQGPTHYWWGPADSLIFSDQFITGGTAEARQRGDTQARVVVIDARLPWDDSGIG